MRKLATIRKVNKIVGIEGADFIELAFIDGWQCIIEKGTFKEGDIGVYFEVDSFLPIEERYEFLRKRCLRNLNQKEGFRLRTMKMRGNISQGLLLPMDNFPEVTEGYEIGEDVTELLNVKLWMTPERFHMSGNAKGNFPIFIRKTDQERIQNLPMIWEGFKDMEFEQTEKLDGTSFTIYKYAGTIGVCSRNLDLELDDDNKENNLYVKYAFNSGLYDWLTESKLDNIAIQGEMIGHGIQKNHYKLSYQKLFVLDIWNIKNQEYFPPENRYYMVHTMKDDGVNLDHVPIRNKNIRILEVCEDMESIIANAVQRSILKSHTHQEGDVYKSIEGNLSFKIVSNKYLLKNDG